MCFILIVGYMWHLDKCILLSKLSILALPYSHRLDDTSAFQQFLKRETKIEIFAGILKQ